jgi:hypothetical protein
MIFISACLYCYETAHLISNSSELVLAGIESTRFEKLPTHPHRQNMRIPDPQWRWQPTNQSLEPPKCTF